MSYALYRMVPIALTTMNNPIFWIFAAIHSFVLGEPRDKIWHTSPTLPMKNLPWKGRGQGYVSNFYIVYFKNIATACRWYTGDIHNSVCGDTYKTMEVNRMSWLSVYYTAHCNPPTSQLRFVQDLLYKSFCTLPRSTQCMGVAWSLSRQSRQRSPEEKSCRPMFWQERDNLSPSNYWQ